MPTLIHFHASDECISDYVQNGFIENLQESIGKINVLLIEYRGFGGSEGKPRLERMLHDGPCVLKSLDLDPSLCVAYGRQAGSLYAIELGYKRKRLRGLILESGIGQVDQYLSLFPELTELLERRATSYAGELKYSKLFEAGNHHSTFTTNRDEILLAMRQWFANAFPGLFEASH